MPRTVEQIALPVARLGTRRALGVHRFGTPGARPKAYIQAALHADETPGMLVAHHLLRRLDHAPVVGEVIVVPVANPIGLAQVVAGTHVGRYGLDGNGNFNRGFPNLVPYAETLLRDRLGADAAANVPLVRKALRAAHAEHRPTGEVGALRHALLGLALDADLVLDLHCDNESVMHLYTGDALWPEAAGLAAELGCRAALLARESGGHPFDEACSAPWWLLAERLGDATPIPPACLAATVELRGKADVDDAQAAADAEALLRVLIRRGVVAGDAGPLPALQCEATPLAGLDRLTAPVSGVLVFHCQVGDHVRTGRVVADIVDPTATTPAAARTPVTAATDGLLMARSNQRFVGLGDLVASIAGVTPLPERGHGLLFD
ncbi:MAG TPA: succinylglutamate desuccinylase/aspartoacylase family protein [Azospirillum sp.]|nr:succinylglutamate desuccinylase/aspartoacylase family protein [Azospirillum sp.]